jgi:excisionase family DNA binding protein
MITKIWLTVAEGAEYCGLSKDTIYAACERGELRHARVGGRRAIRLRSEWIDAWLEQFTRAVEFTPAPRESSGAAIG